MVPLFRLLLVSNPYLEPLPTRLHRDHVCGSWSSMPAENRLQTEFEALAIWTNLLSGFDMLESFSLT